MGDELFCPRCHGIIIWKSGGHKLKNQSITRRYLCNECGLYFRLDKVNPKIKGNIKRFVNKNMEKSLRELSFLIKKHFGLYVSKSAISVYKNKIQNLKGDDKNSRRLG